MEERRDKPSPKGKDDEVWNVIFAFEQILEAMPKDRPSLEALAHAYEQIGDHTRARDYLVRLGDVLVDEQDFVEARRLLENLAPHADGDPKIRELVARIESAAPPDAAQQATQALPKKAVGPQTAALGAGFNMADELDFAWKLTDAAQITQEEYSSVVQDLTEMSTSEQPGTISVLHVLQARNFNGLDRILGFVSRDAKAPIVALTAFESPYEAVTALPLDYMVRRGAIVFELLGRDALVALMNPYNKQLRTDIANLAARRCHFFATTADEFDHAIQRTRDVIERKRMQEEHPA